MGFFIMVPIGQENANMTGEKVILLSQNDIKIYSTKTHKNLASIKT